MAAVVHPSSLTPTLGNRLFREVSLAPDQSRRSISLCHPLSVIKPQRRREAREKPILDSSPEKSGGHRRHHYRPFRARVEQSFRGEFLRTLRRVCDENEALLIFDGSPMRHGLTGKKLVLPTFGRPPRLLVFGKTQVCGVDGRPRLDEVKDNCFRLPADQFTWGAIHRYVRSTHYLRIIEQEKLVDNARDKGEYFLERLRSPRQKVFRDVCRARTRLNDRPFDLPNTALRDAFWGALMNWVAGGPQRRTFHSFASRPRRQTGRH